MRACPADGETARGHGFDPGVVSPHHGRGMDRFSWGFDVRWAKTAYLRAQVGACGKLFLLAKVNATTACEAIRAIEQQSATKGSGASHSYGEPPDELPITMDPNWVSRKIAEFYQAPDKNMGDAQAETERTVSIQQQTQPDSLLHDGNQPCVLVCRVPCVLACLACLSAHMFT